MTREKQERQAVARFNEAHQVGTKVRYQPVLPPRPGIEPKDTTTRSPAMVSHSGHAVVFLTGIAGYVRLSHVELLP